MVYPGSEWMHRFQHEDVVEPVFLLEPACRGSGLLEDITGKLGKIGAFPFAQIDMGIELLALHFIDQVG